MEYGWTAVDSVSGGYTHNYWKGILESYSESSTLDSRDNFKYREYIKDGQSMYEVTETTEIIITVNKDNINLYTHAYAPDGEYYIRIWLDDISLVNTSFTNINNNCRFFGGDYCFTKYKNGLLLYSTYHFRFKDGACNFFDSLT